MPKYEIEVLSQGRTFGPYPVVFGPEAEVVRVEAHEIT